MLKYRSVVFLQGEDADPAFYEYHLEGLDNLFEFLLQWEYGDSIAESQEIPWGSSDTTIPVWDGKIHYVIAYNWNLNYVSLAEVIHV